jgi:hypothetical protein
VLAGGALRTNNQCSAHAGAILQGMPSYGFSETQKPLFLRVYNFKVKMTSTWLRFKNSSV